MVDFWLRRSIELDPRFGMPHALRAFYLFSTATAGHMAFRDGMVEAEAESRTAIRLDADDANGYALLSMCRANLRDWIGAMHGATRAMELGPSTWLSHCAMTMAHMGTRAFDESERQVETMRQIGPRGSGHRVCLMLAANLRFLRGDYAASAASAQALITASPFNPQPYWILLASLGLLGRRDEAAAPLASCLESAPGQSAVYAEMGIPWMAKQDSDLAIEGMRAAGWDPRNR